MMKRVREWWFHLKSTWFLFKLCWIHGEKILAPVEPTVEEVAVKNIATVILSFCKSVHPSLLEELKVFAKEVHNWNPNNQYSWKLYGFPMDVVYKCIELLYIQHFAVERKIPENTPLYMAGYHKGLTDGAVYLDKVPQFSNSDDASVNTELQENVQEKGGGFEIFEPMDRSVDMNKVEMETVVSRIGDDIKVNFVKVNKETDAENLDKN